ncbi:MAG: magnesium chelatase subunit D [Aestuariivita sp.]|nr:magnesium chelatase subunit D [Aestuariivita sp.]MCY4202981.1 magnesium chelatase subunit D [Aestuariivita sp.]
MSELGQVWRHAQIALACLSEEPSLGGMIIRARPSPVRDRLMTIVEQELQPLRRIHPSISDTQLYGDTDVAATLAAGQQVFSRGILRDSQTLVVAMAERCEDELAARLARYIEETPSASLILLDEGASPEERPPDSLKEILAFHVDLEGLGLRDIGPLGNEVRISDHFDTAESAVVSATTPALNTEEIIPLLLQIAADFGINSLRAPLFALRCARTLAKLNHRRQVLIADIQNAVALIYPARATQLPSTDSVPEPEEADIEHEPSDTEINSDVQTLQDRLVDSIRAVLPSKLLDQLPAPSRQRNALGVGSGSKRKGNRRGRPLPSKIGRPNTQSRIDIVATLRAAAPWQPIRSKGDQGARKSVIIRLSDLRLRRFQLQSDRLLIFVVDASGSSAVARLNEAKGAVEILLAAAYASRDHIALIAFRGTGAELLLPPTRSLVQAKRRLASLPGGGGTPLAAGLRQATEISLQSQARGLTPRIIVLTDGRANIALDGIADRSQALQDCVAQGEAMRRLNIGSLLIDTASRPQQGLRELAAQFAASYLPLPRANAQQLSQAITNSLEVS